MNNEPVAWRYWGFNIMNEPAWVYSDEWNKYYPLMGVEPLYTTPQPHPAKTLTDEEIMECWEERDQYANSDYRFNFARAILRKAQEK
jgi:hypothetical protein